MPKKTKKLKLKSDGRKIKKVSEKSNEQITVPQEAEGNTPSQFNFSFRAPTTVKVTRKVDEDEQQSFRLIKKDLYKTVTLAILSMFFLIGLSFILK